VYDQVGLRLLIRPKSNFVTDRLLTGEDFRSYFRRLRDLLILSWTE